MLPDGFATAEPFQQEASSVTDTRSCKQQATVEWQATIEGGETSLVDTGTRLLQLGSANARKANPPNSGKESPLDKLLRRVLHYFILFRSPRMSLVARDEGARNQVITASAQHMPRHANGRYPIVTR